MSLVKGSENFSGIETYLRSQLFGEAPDMVGRENGGTLAWLARGTTREQIADSKKNSLQCPRGSRFLRSRGSYLLNNLQVSSGRLQPTAIEPPCRYPQQ